MPMLKGFVKTRKAMCVDIDQNVGGVTITLLVYWNDGDGNPIFDTYYNQL